MRWLWHRLSSPGLTLILIAALAGICIIGLVVPQYPGLESASATYGEWVRDLGPSARIPGLLGFLAIFSSPWLIAVAALLGVNTIVCVASALRARRVSSAGLGPMREVEVPPVLARARKHIEDHGYRVKTSGPREIRAEKNSFGRVGRYVVHVSLVIMLLGIVYAAASGFQEPFLVVSEGAERAVGHETGLTVRLASASVVYWPDGSAREYRSSVEVLQGGHSLVKGDVVVNHPLSAGGVRLFQAGFGPAPEVLVTDESGVELFHGAVPLSDVLATSGASRPVGMFRLESPPLDIQVVGSAVDVVDPELSDDQVVLQFFEPGSSVALGSAVLAPDQSLSVGGLTFTYGDMRDFSVFTVTRDPGRVVVWIGCGLLLVGLAILLFWPYRVVHIALEGNGGKDGRVTVRVLRPRSAPVPRGIRRLTAELQESARE